MPTTIWERPLSPAQELREEPEQRGERGQAALAAVGAQPLGQIRADRLPQLSAVVPAPGAGPGQAGQRHVVGGAAQFVGPVLEARLPGCGSYVVGLDVGLGTYMVRVRGRGRQSDRLTEDMGAVDGEDVAQQDREGVPVVDQVVLDVDEPVLVVGEPRQRPAQQWRLVRVERGLGLGAQQLGERGLRVGLPGQIHAAQAGRTGVSGPLGRHRARDSHEFQAESGVPVEGGGESAAQGLGVQRPPQVE